MKSSAFRLYCVDVLCILLFSLSCSYILLPLLGHALSPGHQCLLLMALLLFWSLLEVRPWFPFVLLGGAVLLLAVVLLFSGESGTFFSLASGFFTWCFSGMPEDPLYSREWVRQLVYLSLLTPVVLFYWLLLRKFFSLWLLCLLSLGLLLFQGVRNSQDLLFPFLLSCSAIIVCLPRGRLRTQGRLRAQFLAILFLPVILAGSLWIAPSEDGEWTSRSLQHLIHDVQDFWEYHWGDLPDWPITSMRDMGWMPQGDALGGDVEPTDQVILTIDSSSPFLLRGDVLDYYTGHAWQDTPDYSYGNFRLDSLFWQGKREEAYGYRLPADLSAARSLLSSMTISVDARIRCGSKSRSLFLPYRTRQIQLSSSQQELYFNTQGETRLSLMPSYSYSYQVQALAWDHTDTRFDERMLALEEILSSQKDDSYETAAALCLQLPQTLPAWVETLCHEITEGQDSPYEKAMALRDYLSEQCTYTLTPGTPPADEDFVAHFLQDKRGYCVYYASALTVMCRLEGIPARYVTGYGMIPAETGNGYEATQATGHAWTEIYLNQIGWVPLDALSADIFLINTPLPEEPEVSSSTEEETSPVPPEEEPPTESILPEDETEPDSSNPLVLLWVIPLILLLILFLCWGSGCCKRRYSLSYVNRKYPRADQAAEYYYHDFLRQLAFFGLRIHQEDTLLSLGERADRALPPELSVSMAAVFQVMNRLRFGDYLPEPEEIRQMADFHQVIENHLRKVLGFWGYFLRRFLLGFLFSGLSKPHRSS